MMPSLVAVCKLSVSHFLSSHKMENLIKFMIWLNPRATKMKWILLSDWLPKQDGSSCQLGDFPCLSLKNNVSFWPHKSLIDRACVYIAVNFFPTARALIGYFEVTWHLTMKLCLAKITERAGNITKSMTSEGNSALFLSNVDRRAQLQRGLMKFFQLQKSPAIGGFIVTSLFTFLLISSRETKITVSLWISR